MTCVKKEKKKWSDEMKQKQLSVIIPAYNCERYISGCISSIYDNFHGDRNTLEIIVVDDGSEDETPKILDEFQRKYPESMKVIHQDNGGVSRARNAGIECMTGAYFAFMDADDIFMENAIDEFYESIGKNAVDMIVFDYKNINSAGDVVYYQQVTKGLENRESLRKAFLFQHYFNSCWGCVYRTKEENKKLRFPEGVKIGEDVVYMAKVMENIETFACIKKPLYGYRIFGDGVMMQTRNMLDDEVIDCLGNTMKTKETYAIEHFKEQSVLAGYYQEYSQVISAKVHFCMDSNLKKEEKKYQICRFLNNEQVVHTLKAAIRMPGVELKRKVINFIFLNRILRYFYLCQIK